MSDDQAAGERTGASAEREVRGIIVPPQQDQGHPIGVLQTDVTQLQINVALDHRREEFLEFARRITDEQHAIARGEQIEPFMFVEPVFGHPCFLTPRGVNSILGLWPGYAKIVDPKAHADQAGLYVPNRRQRRNGHSL